MLFTWCLLGGLICMFAPVSLTSKLQLAYTYVFSWPLQAGHSLSVASATLSPLREINGSTDTEGATTEHRRLVNHIANLEAQLKEAHREIEQLGRVSAVPQWERMRFQQADITLPGQNQDVLLINRGKQDGVAVGQYVMGDMSIIGVVSAVSPKTAKVKLITDPTSQIAVTLGEPEIDRFMKGEVGNVAKVPLVSALQPVPKGTKVYAKKMPGLLDVPVIAGQVKQCRIDPEDSSVLDITVEPVCDIAGLTGVMVILSSP
jgi:rod shape-determining protein MreC